MAIDNEFIFLEKNNNTYYPEILPSFDASLFLQHSFVFKNGSLSISPGFFLASEYSESKQEIGKITALPYFRRLNLSIFAETFSLTFAKGAISFGEGFFAVNNYFFLNIPVKKRSEAVYHASFEVFAKEFLFNFGTALDTYAIDRYKKPKWYSVWGNVSYSNAIMMLGFASDVLFKEDTTLQFASEASFFLPLEFKIYSSVKLPINLNKKKIVEWGFFIGVDKSFIFDDYSFVSIFGISYGYDRWGYSLFQNIGIKEIINFAIGFTGNNNDSLNLVCSGELFISTFSFKITYITQSFLEQKERLKKEGIMFGLLKLGVSFNE